VGRHPVLRRILIDLVVVGLAALYILWSNTSIGVSRYPVTAAGLPEEFSGFTIAQVSDLHNAEFGAGNHRLLELIAAQDPDIIVLTGDLIDIVERNVKRLMLFGK